jgi:hypothetical protein
MLSVCPPFQILYEFMAETYATAGHLRSINVSSPTVSNNTTANARICYVRATLATHLKYASSAGVLVLCDVTT